MAGNIRRIIITSTAMTEKRDWHSDSITRETLIDARSNSGENYPLSPKAPFSSSHMRQFPVLCYCMDDPDTIRVGLNRREN